MSEPDTSRPSRGRGRLCPHCGTRVAQKAQSCFFCGAALESAPRRRLAIPWAELILFAVIASLVAFWWLRSPVRPSIDQLAQVGGEASPENSPTVPALLLPHTPLPPTDTPEPTDTPVPTATAVPTPIRYIVQPGDTLETIAGFHGAKLEDVLEANGLSPLDLIHPGDEILIPAVGPIGGPGPTATPAGGTLVYSVKPGDTLDSIAMRFDSQIDWILRANDMDVNDLLQINQTLLVPLSPETPTPTPEPGMDGPDATTAPVVRFPAPMLLTPADGEKVTGDDQVLISWTSVGVLAEDQWYVVTLAVDRGEEPIAPYWTKATTWRLSADHRLAGPGPTTFTWQVQVISGSPEAPGETLSPLSAVRTFTWE